jgi:hypothetical protein
MPIKLLFAVILLSVALTPPPVGSRNLLLAQMSPQISSTTATETASDNANATPNAITSRTMTFMIRLFPLFAAHVDPQPNSGHRTDCPKSTPFQ